MPAETSPTVVASAEPDINRFEVRISAAGDTRPDPPRPSSAPADRPRAPPRRRHPRAYCGAPLAPTLGSPAGRSGSRAIAARLVNRTSVVGPKAEPRWGLGRPSRGRRGSSSDPGHPAAQADDRHTDMPRDPEQGNHRSGDQPRDARYERSDGAQEATEIRMALEPALIEACSSFTEITEIHKSPPVVEVIDFPPKPWRPPRRASPITPPPSSPGGSRPPAPLSPFRRRREHRAGADSPGALALALGLT